MPGTFRRLFRLPWRRGPADELDEELEFHFSRTIEQLQAEGYDREAATAEAHRRFGNLAQYRAGILEIDRSRNVHLRRSLWWDRRVQDFREAGRSVVRDRGFLVLVALTLGLGVGTVATMFGIVDRLLLTPPPGLVEPADVARLSLARIRQGEYHVGSWVSWQDLQDLENNPSFAAAAGYTTAGVLFGEGREARSLSAVLFSEEYFELFGTRPALGRFPTPLEHPDSGAIAPAVLGWEFWRGSFGSDPGVLGRVLTLGDGRYEVVGVAREDFTGIDLQRVDVWLPMRAAAHEAVQGSWRTSRRFYWIRPLVRFAPQVTPEAAIASASAHYRQVNRDSDNQVDRAGFLSSSVMLGDGSRAAEARVSLWLTWVSLAVLAIATANVANLQMVRAVRRKRETAVRLALGIGRSRLLGQLALEGVAFSLAGLALGLVLTAVAGSAFRRYLLPDITWPGGAVDGRMLGLAILLGLAAGLLAVAVPGWQAAKTDFVEHLKTVGRGGKSRTRLQSALLVTQATLSVVLLAGAGLFVKSLQAVRGIDLGWEPSTTLVATYSTLGFDVSREELHDWYRTAAARLGRSNAVAGVALTSAIPFWHSWAEELSVPGRDSLPRLPDGGPYIVAVSPSYFETVGLAVIEGRGFSETDTRGGAGVTIVSETMAELFWPGEDPLGQCLQIGGVRAPCSTVVGIAEDSHRQRIFEGRTMLYYIPLEQDPFGMGIQALMAKSTGSASAPTMRTVLQAVAPQLPAPRVMALEELVAPQTRSWRLGATMFTVFGGLALAVAAVGLFSLLSYLVGSQLPELGIRAALGASKGELIRLVLLRALALLGAGTALGTAVGLIAGRWLEPMLYQVTHKDPGVYLGVAILLVVTGLIAALLPSLRASRVDPARALRAD